MNTLEFELTELSAQEFLQTNGGDREVAKIAGIANRIGYSVGYIVGRIAGSVSTIIENNFK